MNRGWTLHEMIVSLAVTAGIFVLASNAAVAHLRWVRGAGEVVALRTQLGQATAIAASVLRAVERPADILVAQDSVAEVLASYGVTFACRTDTGRLLLPDPAADAGGVTSSFGDRPQPGDLVRILLVDDTSAAWIAAHVATSPASGGACAGFPGVTSTWSIALVEPFVVPQGAALRLARRTRVSGYRASDGRWYLGMRDWNGTTAGFNTIQPVAGPLLAASPDGAKSGFLLTWSDSTGTTWRSPANPADLVRVTITARGETVRPARIAGMWSRAAPRYEDSLSSVVVFRNR